MERFEVFSSSILELSRNLQKIKDMGMKALGLRGNQVMCLYYLGKYPEGLTSGELTELCREDKAATSRNLSELIAKGLVRGEFPENRRAYRTRLFLTDAGREVVLTIEGRINEAMTYGGSGLTEEQRVCFYAVMETILENMSRYLAENP